MTKQQTAGQRIIASAKEALTFAQGDGSGCVVHAPKAMDAVRIRKKIKRSQSQFTKYFGVSVRAIQKSIGVNQHSKLFTKPLLLLSRLHLHLKNGRLKNP